MQIDFESPKQHQTTTRRLATLAAVAAMTVGGAAACASTTASAKPSAAPSGVVAAPQTVSPSGSPSIQPGGPMIPVPATSAPGTAPSSPGSSPGSGSGSGKPSFTATGYTANGDKLTVDFFAGICDKYGLQADQSASGEVRVTILVSQYPQPGTRCPMLVRQQQVSTDMGSPLDGRKVVDSSNGKVLPQLDTPDTGNHYSPGPVKIGA